MTGGDARILVPADRTRHDAWAESDERVDGPGLPTVGEVLVDQRSETFVLDGIHENSSMFDHAGYNTRELLFDKLLGHGRAGNRHVRPSPGGICRRASDGDAHETIDRVVD